MASPGVRPFHDVDDPFRFVRRALDDELRARGGTLRPDMYEEAEAYLLERLVRLSRRYDPARGELSFSTYAYRILRRRYTDFLRDVLGDRRYGNDGREVTMAETPLEGFTEDPETFEALVESIDHDRLSPRARGALRRIARLIAEDGLTATEAAARLGKTRREALADLRRLRLELGAAA